MCLICVEFEKGKLTQEEAWKNLSEMAESVDPKHAIEIIKKLIPSGLHKFDKLNHPIYIEQFGNFDFSSCFNVIKMF